MFSLQEKTAVITGGGSGIGLAISKLFSQQGAQVHILELNPTATLASYFQEIEPRVKVHVHACDVSNSDQMKSVFQSIGAFDILVNNAGIAHIGNAENTTEEELDRLYQINVKGVFLGVREAIPVFKKNNKGGVILNMASIASSVGLADRFAYSMSKGAVRSMTQSIARDFIHDQIRCNCISPARIHTPFVDGFIQQFYPGKEEEIFKKLSHSQPIGRMGTPEEVAHLALYLCSEEAGFVTGCDYPIDGGFIHLNT